MKPTKPVIETQQIAKTVLTSPDGLESELTLYFEDDSYEILLEEEADSGWTECASFVIDSRTEDEARKTFVLFVIDYGKSFQR